MPVSIAVAQVTLASLVLLFLTQLMQWPGGSVMAFVAIGAAVLFPLAFLLELAGVFKALLGR